MILADDLGWGDVGYNGQKKIKTPNIDELANGGLKFNQFYAGSSVCAPSRASLLTGVNTAHAHIRELSAWTASGNPIDLKDEEITLAEELKKKNYKTGIIGKWGLEEGAGTGMPNKQGFDYFFGFKTHTEAHHYYPEYYWENGIKIKQPNNNPKEKIGEYSNDVFYRKAVEFIKENKEDPFFLYLPYTVPHNEITVPNNSKEQYQGLGWPKRHMQSGHYFHDEEGNLAYAGMVSRFDSYVGGIQKLLEKEGILENTIIIITSDNGPGFDNGFFKSSGPFRGGKLQLYEGGIRVPFVLSWPKKVKSGREIDSAFHFCDIYSTISHIADVKIDKEIDGISFLPSILNQGEQKYHDFLYWEINESKGPIQAIRIGDWKGIKFHEKPFELFNIKKDPSEMYNLSEDYPGIVSKIKQIMLNTRTDNPEFPLTKRSPNYDNTSN
ncbi:arylsulfatase [Sphingobacterium kyonggiense]